MKNLENKKTEIKIKRSIRFKIMVLTTMIVLGVMLVCTAIMRYSMRSLTETILIDVLQPAARQSAKAVEANIHLMSDRIMDIASDSTLAREDATPVQIDWVLDDAANTYEFYGIGVYGTDGKELAAVGEVFKDFASTEMFSLLKETDNMVITDPVINDQYIGIPAGMPVKADGKTISYLVGIYKYDMLSDVLGSIHIGHTGMAIIINESGKITGHPSADMVRQELNIYDLDKEESAHKIYDSMLARETGTTEGIVNGQDAYVSYCPVRGTKWSFAVQVPKKDYMRPANVALYSTMTGTAGVLVLALAAIWLVTTVISGQLKKTITRMNWLSEGDLKSDIEVKKSGDEIEILSLSLKTTVEHINGYITEIKRVLENISAGNLDISADGDYKGDFIVIGDSLTKIIVSLNSIMKQINHTSHQLADTAHNMEIQSKELHQAAYTQTSAMESLTSEVDIIKNNLSEVTENTKCTRQSALEIAGQISDSNMKMYELKEAIGAIEKNAYDVNKISLLVEDIARQTKILALNATVEAARAGEAGSGFAVVAQEVRKLAEESEEAAKNTTNLISQSGVLIARGVELTNETAKSLELISNSSDEVTNIAGHLSKAVAIQESSLYEITDKIDEISTITEKNLQSARNTEGVSTGLKTESEKLKELLNKFQFH